MNQRFCHCSSANAAPEFEGRGGEELAVMLGNTLATAYESDEAFDTKDLCILPGQQCWKLYVDILVRLTLHEVVEHWLELIFPDSRMWW